MKRTAGMLLLLLPVLALSACAAPPPEEAPEPPQEPPQGALAPVEATEQEKIVANSTEPLIKQLGEYMVALIQPTDQGYDYYEGLLGETIIASRGVDWNDANTTQIGEYRVVADYGLYLEQRDGTQVVLVEGNDTPGEDLTAAFVYRVLDEHRFVYETIGNELSKGCGIFDLQTMDDYPLFSQETLLGRVPLLLTEDALYTIGDVFYGSYTGDFNLGRTDLTNYRTERLLADLTEDFLRNMVSYKIAPDGRVFVIATRNPGEDQGLPLAGEPGDILYLFDTASGALLLEYPLAAEERAWDMDTLLFPGPQELLYYTTETMSGRRALEGAVLRICW